VRMHTGGACPDCEKVCGACVTATGRVPFKASRARYIPIDAGNDGTDLEEWTSPRSVDFMVALEVVEHVSDPARLINAMLTRARKGVIISTPNPETTDVLGMDRTHVSVVGRSRLESHGFTVREESFYGQPADSLFAVWAGL
jgi:hypothetical protein